MSKRFADDFDSDPAKRIKFQGIPGPDTSAQIAAELDEEEIILLASQNLENNERITSCTGESSSISTKSRYGMSSTSKSVGELSSNKNVNSNAFSLPPSNSRSYKSTSNQNSNKKFNEHGIVDMSSKTSFTNGSSDEYLLEKLREIKEENQKYQLHQSELTEKNIVKDGEISILRAQLKSCQIEMNKIKMEKIKCSEKNQVELSNKINQMNVETRKQKSELDLKIMENAQLKEKCRTLESSRVKFVEPSPVADHFKWSGSTQKLNSSFSKQENNFKHIISTKEVCVQTWKRNRIRLCPLKRPNYPLKIYIKNCIYKNTKSEDPIVFCSNENSPLTGYFNFLPLRENILTNMDDLGKSNCTKGIDHNIKLDCIYGDLSLLMDTSAEELCTEKSIFHALKIVLISKEFLLKSFDQLKNLENKVSMRILKEMDVKYFESSKVGNDLLIHKYHFSESAWFKDEQCIDLRRILAVVAVICKFIPPLSSYFLDTENIQEAKNIGISRIETIKDFQKNLYYNSKYNEKKLIFQYSNFDIILEILKIILKIRCSHLYTGLLSSICLIMDSSLKNCSAKNPSLVHDKVCTVTKQILMMRPHIVIIKNIMSMLVSVENISFLKLMCNNSDHANLKFDSSEGVVIYSEDTCALQILSNLLETWSTHFVQTDHISMLISITNNLLKFNRHEEAIIDNWNKINMNYKCLCLTRLNRCIWVYLRQCASLFDKNIGRIEDQNLCRRLCSTLRAGIMLLNFCILKDTEFLSRLKDYEGHCQIFVSLCDKFSDRLQLHIIHKKALASVKKNMNFVLGYDEEPVAKNILDLCFQQFSLND